MPNRAFLIGSNQGETAGPIGDALNYDPDTEILAGASLCIPLFWLTPFDESCITNHMIENHAIPSLVAEMHLARVRTGERAKAILAMFPSCETEWLTWVNFIDTAPFSFLKVDALEICILEEPGIFERKLPAAIRWFSSRRKDDFRSLLSLAEIRLLRKRWFFDRRPINPNRGYDPVAKTLSIVDPNFPGIEIRLSHLYGYKWVREVPWDG